MEVTVPLKVNSLIENCVDADEAPQTYSRKTILVVMFWKAAALNDIVAPEVEVLVAMFEA